MSDPAPSRRLRGTVVLDDLLVQELLEARSIGVLATFDRAGFIHAVPMWFAAADGCVLLATGSRSRKVANLARDPRATLVVHDSRPGFEVCGASIAGTVEIVTGNAARALVDAVHRRYVLRSAEQEPSLGAFLASDDVALRFVPTSAFTWDERENVSTAILRQRGAALPLVTTEPRPERTSTE